MKLTHALAATFVCALPALVPPTLTPPALAPRALAQPALAQPAPDAYRPWLPSAIEQSPALRAFTVAPFADADIKTGETLLVGFYIVSTDPRAVTLKIVAATPAGGETKSFDPPRAREIRLADNATLWANAKKRATLDWGEQVVDGAPVLVVGKEGAAGQPFVARKVDVVDGFIGDLLKDPEFQQRLQEVRKRGADQENMLNGTLPTDAMWLETVGVDQMTSGYGTPRLGKSVDDRTLTLGGLPYEHGIGTHAESDLVIDLKGKATRFASMVGVDEEITSRGSVVFSVWVDGEKVAGSTIMRVGDEPEFVEADLTGAKTLRLQVSDAGDSANSDHADWAGAFLELTPATDAKNPSSRPAAINYPSLNIAAPPSEDDLRAGDALPDAIWLETLDLNKMSAGYGRPRTARSVDNNPLRLAGREYPHGVGTHASSRFAVDLKGNATRFAAMVGIDDEIGTNGSVEFSVWVDGQEMANTGTIRAREGGRFLSVNLRGASRLELRALEGEDGINSDHADWAGAMIQLIPGTTQGEAPVATELEEE